MTPHEAAIELEQAIAKAITQYEQAAPGGICIGIFVDRLPGGFVKVKPRLKTTAHPSSTAPTSKGPANL